MRSTPPAVRALAHWSTVYRRTWRGSVITTLLSPVLYLAALGLGLGTLVARSGQADAVGDVPYVVFLAPGILAATAMQTAAVEATWPVMAATKWQRTYHGMLATPLRVRDVLAGHLAWITVRVAIASAAFLGVSAAFGATRSALAPLALPAAVLVGIAFAAPIAAFAMTVRTDALLVALLRFGVLPLFLFSGTFFPLDRMPAALSALAAATPLWHGVDLCRTLALGGATWAGSLGHVAYLVVMAALGWLWALRAYERRLAP